MDLARSWLLTAGPQGVPGAKDDARLHAERLCDRRAGWARVTVGRLLDGVVECVGQAS